MVRVPEAIVVPPASPAGGIDHAGGIGMLHPLEAGRQQQAGCRVVAGIGEYPPFAAEDIMDSAVGFRAAGLYLSEPVGHADEAVEGGHRPSFGLARM